MSNPTETKTSLEEGFNTWAIEELREMWEYKANFGSAGNEDKALAFIQAVSAFRTNVYTKKTLERVDQLVQQTKQGRLLEHLADLKTLLDGLLKVAILVSS
jgi:hypothetical protein